jgi:ABC-type multidrug transport system fused ATPase/permease subunit
LWSQRTPKEFLLPSELRWLAKEIRPLLHLHLASFLCITGGSLLGLLTPLVLKWLIDGILPHKQLGLLLLAVGSIFLAYQGRTALIGVGNYLTLSSAQRMGLALRLKLLRHLDTLPAEYYEATAVGNVMYPFNEPVAEIAYFGSDLLPAILRALLTTSFTVATMFALSPALTLAVLPLIPVFLIVRQHFRRRLSLHSDLVEGSNAAWNEFLEEHLTSVISIELLGQQKRQERRAFQYLARVLRSQQQLFRSGIWFSVGISFAVVLSICAVIGYGGARVLAGGLSVGSLVAFYSFVTQLFEPLSGAAELYARAQKTFASIRQVKSTFALSATICNAAVTIVLPRDHPPSIEFAGVRFGHARQKNMVQIPALRILPGEKVAIVGENGAGKSTLAKLIARIYDVNSGSVQIGRADIRDIELASLRRFVCYLSREPVLFSGTLASNLHFVKPTAQEEEFHDVIRLVGLSGFIATLADGLHQRVGPGACQLSGGQRQRLALARALLQQPRILILDEATSCLDPSSEKQLLGNIRKTLYSATLIVISHRLSTLTSFQRVLVLSDGRIVEDGNPDSFLVAGGAYSSLFALTASKDPDLQNF